MLLFAAVGHGLEAPSINVQTHEPAAGLHDGALTRSALRQATDEWHGVATLHYANRSLTFVNNSDGTKRVQTVLGDLWMLDVGGSFGWRGWLFEATLPVAWVIRGGGPNLVQIDPPQAPAFGDLRLAARRHLWRYETSGTGQFDLEVTYAGGGTITVVGGATQGSGLVGCRELVDLVFA